MAQTTEREDNYTEEELRPFTNCVRCNQEVHISLTFIEEDGPVCPECGCKEE